MKDKLFKKIEDEANVLSDIKKYKNKVRNYLTPIPHNNNDLERLESGFKLPRIKIQSKK